MIISQNGPVVSYDVWLAALASSACIGFTSLVPWLFNMTFFEQSKNNLEKEDGRMKYLLSFAVGAILGDIFFHLIPESLQSHRVELNDSISSAHRKIGLSVIAGIFMFIIVEMILEKWSHSVKEEHQVNSKNADVHETIQNSENLHTQLPVFADKDLIKTEASLILNHKSKNFLENNNNIWPDLNSCDGDNQDNIQSQETDELVRLTDQNLTYRGGKKSELIKAHTKNDINSNQVQQANDKPDDCQTIDTAGYLSLIANGFDNFTHGLAIGASFLVGTKVGLLTTFVIFIHEIPHEICDYAILVNSGFSRWDAVKAQSSVSLFGTLGTATALYVKSVQILNAKTIWILPFSAGGFLYIALVNLLPEILDQKTDTRNSLGQIACVILGITFMASVAFI